MTDEIIREKLGLIEKDRVIQNLIAQANARYILLNTSESRNNFPPYTINDDRLNILSFYYLNFGCSFAENHNFDEAIEPLEKGASLLEFVHAAETNKTETSNYYGLIGSLAYYVSFQYSKSFILIKKYESTSVIAKIIHLFLLRKFIELSEEINKIIVDNTYQDRFISKNIDEIDGSTKVYEITIAKALDGFLKYFYTGDLYLLNNSKQLLKSIKEISEIETDPGIWWVIRLLLLISEGFNEASLWNVLNKHFDLNHPKVSQYIKSLVYMSPRGIYELFITQRKSLNKVLNATNGCIVSIPTSSGKTRIAEIAILNCFLSDQTNKVLYIAPFRSLAFEVENTLEPILDNSGISVSHLYGGSLYSKLDEKIINDSDVIIATPEKAKSIIRGSSEIINQIKLIIIDEGHLLGANKRLIVNEIFYEELRFYVQKNGGKFLLLSAVLPNSEELAEWLTQSSENIYKNTWRPSEERLGILDWDGKYVNINWLSKDVDRQSFNNQFIATEELPLGPRQRKIRYFPSNKNEAIAATAYKLRTFGSVLIFVGLKASVFKMAEAYFKCLGNTPENHQWKNVHDWRAFELACIETYGEKGNRWLSYARKGILCHNADLHSDVRLPLERLMRSDKPLAIISTSTLGQGVNLGVSTVIFSTLYQAGEIINARDFWNIAGRAGRAFVDHEGKILVALDTWNSNKNQIKSRVDKIKEYFDKSKIDLAHSGILSLIVSLKKTAQENDIDFDQLIQLIADNKTSDIGEKAGEIDDVLDWLDDTLLSLLHLNSPERALDLSWVESFFRQSLAYIQSKNEENLSGNEITNFMKSRFKGIVEKVGTDRIKWQSIISSGIPLNSDLIIEDRLSKLTHLVQEYVNEDETTIGRKISLLSSIEELITDLPVLIEDGDSIKSKDINIIREKWINASPISTIIPFENGIEIITKLYTFKLPWILNGISKKMKNVENVDEAAVIEELSILVESGLPSLTKVKIYQAGIRSRSSANEIGELFDDELWERSNSDYKRDLILHKDFYKEQVSVIAGEWLDLLSYTARRRSTKIRKILPFTFGNIHEKINILIAKKINDKQYLLSPDLSVVKDISEFNIDFSAVNNILGIDFKYDPEQGNWVMINNNPYVQFTTY